MISWNNLLPSIYGESEDDNYKRLDFLNWLGLSPSTLPASLGKEIKLIDNYRSKSSKAICKLYPIDIECIVGTSHSAYGNKSIVQIFRSLKRAPYYCPKIVNESTFLWESIGKDQLELDIAPVKAFETATLPGCFSLTNGNHRVIITMLIYYTRPDLLPDWFDGQVYVDIR
ncbi:MAG TPA: hypothetical protein VFD00_02110 [Thermoclostridium sp.]|nr:hypothetical protein [Fastidiosipila sp.]HZK26321.1 hypothetical protein [Thermoclostridium sp.]